MGQDRYRSGFGGVIGVFTRNRMLQTALDVFDALGTYRNSRHFNAVDMKLDATLATGFIVKQFLVRRL